MSMEGAPDDNLIQALNENLLHTLETAGEEGVHGYNHAVEIARPRLYSILVDTPNHSHLR